MPPTRLGPKIMTRATFRIMAILLSVAHTTGLCIVLHCLRDKRVAAIMYEMLAR
jgi:hypothetical protein